MADAAPIGVDPIEVVEAEGEGRHDNELCRRHRKEWEVRVERGRGGRWQRQEATMGAGIGGGEDRFAAAFAEYRSHGAVRSASISPFVFGDRVLLAASSGGGRAGDEADHVDGPGNALGLRGSKKHPPLIEKPQEQYNARWGVDVAVAERKQWTEESEQVYLLGRERDGDGAHQRRDRSRRTNQWNGRAGEDSPMRQRRQQSAACVQRDEFLCSPFGLDNVAEDAEEVHVAAEMPDVGVQEHRREEREDIGIGWDEAVGEVDFAIAECQQPD